MIKSSVSSGVQTDISVMMTQDSQGSITVTGWFTFNKNYDPIVSPAS